ncbi:cob(I)yrinic acid a,c-diamide adenosyltransferase [Liquorilactobacillus oeni]|uniref:Corrinoid adenosyltransferase n=1 Tax=Liquorilactobacillus oeni DSM 19972 TaxID=1423777 RepID=A0A0R1MB95_9LACO|nr:cob(I)yrinic acid a,c-diamide adenosyltransferase [Liquorilactobacillus oeni]KRL05391.1 hypothetical protein FD46_GL000798 [Liquorilactobacillus oeni DSM 19972]
MKIYTKVGDKGQTKQVSGKMVPKYDPQITALGDLDELQAWLGFTVTLLSPNCQKLLSELQNVQKKLYFLQADICIKHHAAITAADTADLEKKIDHFMNTVPQIHEFILPGGKQTGAALQYGRTLARRAERSAVSLNKKQELSPALMSYLNRLSDYLFAMARYANYLDKAAEVVSKL